MYFDASIIQPFIRISMGTCLVFNEYLCKSHQSSNFQISVPMSLCLSCYSLQVLCAENAKNNNITPEVGKTKDIPIACQIYYSCHCWKLPAHCGCRDMLLNCVALTNPREICTIQSGFNHGFYLFEENIPCICDTVQSDLKTLAEQCSYQARWSKQWSGDP